MAEYNGWTNYATWGVNLVLGNQPETEKRIAAIVSEGTTTYSVETAIRDYVKDELLGLAFDAMGGPIDPYGMVGQVLYAGLGEVNWREIAECWIEGYGK